MKLEQASSLDLQREVTAEQADALFSQGIMVSKHRFECPELGCHAQVTCANLDKPRAFRQRDPYFKFVSEHSPGCPLKSIWIVNCVKFKARVDIRKRLATSLRSH